MTQEQVGRSILCAGTSQNRVYLDHLQHLGGGRTPAAQIIHHALKALD